MKFKEIVIKVNENIDFKDNDEIIKYILLTIRKMDIIKLIPILNDN